MSQINSRDAKLDFLKNCDYDSVDFFSLKNWKGWAKVVKLYDGDTMTVVLFTNDKPFKFRIRLANIDTAEKTSKNTIEAEWAQKAIKLVTNFIGEQKLVYLECDNNDKYGRVLAHIYQTPDADLSLNDILLRAGLAYKYNGGKRKPFNEWCNVTQSQICGLKHHTEKV